MLHSVLKHNDDEFLLLVASADKSDGQELQLDGSKAKVKIQYGDFSDALTKAVNALTEVIAIHCVGLFSRAESRE